MSGRESELGFDINEQYGSLMIASVVDALLYGVTSFQVYLYYQRWEQVKKDGWLAYMIFMLWCLDALHLAMVVQGTYWYLVSSYGRPETILTPTWGLVNEIFVTAIINGCCQMYLAWRIWLFASSRNGTLVKIGIAIAGLLAFAGFVVGLTFGGVWAGASSMVALQLPVPTALLWAELIIAMVCDILIAACSVTQLVQSRSGFSKTKSIIDTLILYSINTCLVTTAVAIACFVVYVTRPTSDATIALYTLLSKFYFNCFMSNVNSRANLRGKNGSSYESSNGGNTGYPLNIRVGENSVHGRTQQQSVIVSVQRDVESDQDLEERQKQKPEFDYYPS